MSFLIEDGDRFNAFPIAPREKKYYDSYISQRAAYWIEKEIDSELEKDKPEWRDDGSIIPEIKITVNRAVGVFNIADGITNLIIGDALQANINNRIYQILMNFTKAMEDIHNITYSKLAEVYLLPGQTIETLSEEIINHPVIKKRINWLLSSVGLSLETKDYNVYRNLPDDQKQLLIGLLADKKDSLSKKILNVLKMEKVKPAISLLLNCFNEGVGFTSVFCVLFWIKERGILRGLVKANELISRDENAHKEVGIMAFRELNELDPLPESVVHEIFRNGLEIERDFVNYLLPHKLLGLNSEMMTEYVEFIADRLLSDLGYKPLYGDRKCPFSFITLQSSGIRSTDFFVDPSVSEYNDEKRGENTINIDKYVGL